MSFQPVIPMSGFTGWRFLSRTMAPQQAAFDRSPVVEKEVRYFQQNIAKVSSAAELVGDRKLLKVADVVGIADDGVANLGGAHALSRALERLQQEFCVVISRGFLKSARLAAFANQQPALRAVCFYYGIILDKQGGKGGLHIFALLAVELKGLVIVQHQHSTFA